MRWLIEHWQLVSGSSAVLFLLFLWQRGFFGWAWRCILALRKALRDQERADAKGRLAECETKLADIRAVLKGRILTDDSRDEIHQQDLADKKQMAACIARLKQRLTENRIPFDDLL